MKKTRKIDGRVPTPMPETSEQFFYQFFNELPNHLDAMFSIQADEVKSFKKLSPDDESFVDDVIAEMSNLNSKIASNVSVKNIKQATKASEQYNQLAILFEKWGIYFSRNAMQAGSFSYQHAAVYEDDVDNALQLNIKGANEIKERLEGNRAKRNAAAAATRVANAAQRKAEEIQPKAGNGG